MDPKVGVSTRCLHHALSLLSLVFQGAQAPDPLPNLLSCELAPGSLCCSHMGLLGQATLFLPPGFAFAVPFVGCTPSPSS